MSLFVDSFSSIIYYLKKPNNENIQAFTSSYSYYYIRIILPHIKDNYTFYKGYGFSNNNETYWHFLSEFKVNKNSDEEIRLYINPSYDPNIFPIRIVYGFDREYYPENLKVEEFEINDELPIIGLQDSKFFKLPNEYSFYKCKNKKAKFIIGYEFKNYFRKEVNNFVHFKFLSYSFLDILEIDADEEFLLFEGEDERENNNITIFTGGRETNEIERTFFYIQFEKPLLWNKQFYIFAPKTDYYMENIPNECFLYNLFYWKNNYNDIFILENEDLSQVLKKKKSKEFIVTVVLLYEYNYKKRYYFYNSSIIKISQKLLDQDYDDDNSLTKQEIIFIIIGVIVGGYLFLFLLLIIINKCLKKNLPTINENMEGEFGLLN